MKKNTRIFLLAIAAGIAIAAGGTVYLTLENKVLGSLLFSVGLYAILLNGLYLYTGKTALLLKEKNKKEYLLVLLLSWIGNFVGVSFGGFTVLNSRIRGIRDTAVSVTEVKLGDTPLSIFLLSVFCGFLVYVAVEGFKQTGNPAVVLMCVTAFMLSGFEHCIANMFYFIVAGAWSFKALIYLLIMTLGNTVGSMLIPVLKGQGELH